MFKGWTVLNYLIVSVKLQQKSINSEEEKKDERERERGGDRDRERELRTLLHKEKGLIF